MTMRKRSNGCFAGLSVRVSDPITYCKWTRFGEQATYGRRCGAVSS